jgi:hypothetical protein
MQAAIIIMEDGFRAVTTLEAFILLKVCPPIKFQKESDEDERKLL